MVTREHETYVFYCRFVEHCFFIHAVSVVEQPLALRKPFAVPSLSGQTMKLTTTVSSSLHRLVQCTVVTRKLKTVVCVCVCLHSLKLYSHYMTQVSEAALSCQDLQHSIRYILWLYIASNRNHLMQLGLCMQLYIPLIDC